MSGTEKLAVLAAFLSLLLPGCRAPDQPAQPGPEPTAAASPTAEPTDAAAHTPTISPTVAPEVDAVTLTAPPGFFETPSGAPVAGVVTPAAAPAGPALEHTLPDVGFIPANVEAWNTYLMPLVDLAVPIPPDWLVQAWPTSDGGQLFYSVSVMPQAYTNIEVYGYQPPAIGLAVYRDPLTGTLDNWLADHSTAEPFGSDAGERVVFHGVSNIQQRTVNGMPAAAFTSEAMGILIYNVILSAGNAVIDLNFSHQGNVPFEPVFETMLQGVQPLP